MNGCICCTVRGDLVVALKKLFGKVAKFDGVIIETTGLADPAPVCQTFFVDDDVKQMYRLDSVITVADAKYIVERLDEKKPEGVENEAVEQVCFADKILLNKIDLVTDEQQLVAIEKKIRGLNPTATIQRTSHSKIDPRDFLDIGAFDLKRVLDFDPEFLDENAEHEHDATVSSVAVKKEGQVNKELLERWIERLIVDEGANLYRYKGVVAVRGEDRKFIFQGVGMMFTGGFCTTKWKPGEVRENRFVFIGKNLDHGFHRRGFEACMTTGTLRFPIGAKVEANVGFGVGGYTSGKVTGHWDEGAAYLVMLDDEDETVVEALIDIDEYIRAPTK
mmetsp:Transcript_48671/g.95146  ORF Transcript_48671/g.95146 Transcript_48671/m.95146 type:complete len:333 (+) Transcript_48671:2-1000(+)